MSQIQVTVSFVNQDTSFLSGSLKKFCETQGLDESLILKYEPTMLLVEHDIRFQEKVGTSVIKI